MNTTNLAGKKKIGLKLLLTEPYENYRGIFIGNEESNKSDIKDMAFPCLTIVNMSFKESSFRNINFSYCAFTNCYLRGAKFYNCNFTVHSPRFRE